MQFRKKLLLFALLAFTFGLSAQELRVNEKGEKIIVYPDGSWQYFSNFGAGGLEWKASDSETQPDKNTYPIFDGKIEPLDGAVAITEEDLFKVAVRRSQLAQEASAIASERAREAVRQRENLEKELKEALQVEDKKPERIRQLNIRLKAARKTEQETAYEAQVAMAEARRADELTAKGAYVRDYKESQRKKSEQARLVPNREQLVYSSYENLLSFDKNFHLFAGEENVILHPPPAECRIAFEGIDEYSGRRRRDVQKQFLFSHTDERLRLFLKDKEYLRCEGFFSSIAGGFWFLSLEFTFAYPNAREAYGFIEKGSILTIKLLNGDFVNLRAGKMDRGSYDTEREILTYRVHYPLDRTQINLLMNSEVDSIRVFWSSGYEEYEVFNLGFFKNQISCLGNG